jgi:hypothetical protein
MGCEREDVYEDDGGLLLGEEGVGVRGKAAVVLAGEGESEDWEKRRTDFRTAV